LNFFIRFRAILIFSPESIVMTFFFIIENIFPVFPNWLRMSPSVSMPRTFLFRTMRMLPISWELMILAASLNEMFLFITWAGRIISLTFMPN
jgi:hypothetical protein